MKSIFKAVATVTIFSVITRMLGFFFRVFLSHKIGAMGLGLYQMATSILGIFMTLISSGLPLTTAKLVSKYEINKNFANRNKAVGSSLIIALALACFSALIIFLLRNVWGFVLTDNRAVEILIILIPSIIFNAIYAIFRGALWGQHDYFNCGLTELIEQIIRLVLTFIMLLNIKDIFVATKQSAIAFNLTCLCSALITIVIYIKRGRISFKKGEYKNVLKSAVPITGVRLANSLVQPLTTLIIPTMLILSGYTSTEAVESVGVVMGMTFPMLFVPMAVIGSISMVLIPSISSMMAKNNYSEIQENIKSSLEVSIFISMLFIPLYLSVGDLICVVLYNNQMSGAILKSSALCILPITICNLSGSILNALNLEVKSFANYILGSLTLLVSLVVLTPLLGINAITTSFFISMSVISLLNLSKIKKAIPNLKFNLIKISFKYLLIILPCSLLGSLIANICNHFLPAFFSCVIAGGTSILFTLILSNAFNLYKFNNLLNLIKRKRKT